MLGGVRVRGGHSLLKETKENIRLFTFLEQKEENNEHRRLSTTFEQSRAQKEISIS